MENKKNPNVDLNNKRTPLILLGLIVSLSLTLAAFEWKQLGSGDLMDLGSLDDPFDEMIDVPITEIKPPKKPPIQQPKLIEIPNDEEIEDDIEIEIDIDITETQVIEDVIIIQAEEEETNPGFVFAPEISASFPGEDGAWSKFLNKNLKYPRSAQRMGIEGKVYLKFIVDKNGAVSDITVIRGIGGGCDEEAIRVLKKSPNWSPGKQRGRPVKSPMAIAVVFRLK